MTNIETLLISPPWLVGNTAELSVTSVADRSSAHLVWDVPTIVPGQPLSFFWDFLDLLQSDIGEITGTVHLGINLSEMYTIYTSAPLSDQFIVSEDVKNVSLPLPTDSEVVRNFYRIGALNHLSLEVTGSGTDRGPYWATDSVYVVGEEITKTWWEWTTLQGTEHHGRSRLQFAWKDDYMLGGRIINQSKHAAMSGRATLYEQEGGGGALIDRGFTDFQVNPMGSVDVTFPKVKQDWKWLIPVVWIVNEPLSKSFSYTVKFSLNDPYGNAYAENWSAPLDISVWVSDTKSALGYAAEAHQIIAEVLIGLSWLPGVGAAIGAAVAIAAGLGAGALDPPEADPRYREAVHVDYQTLPRALAEEPTLAAIGRVLELTGRIAASREAIGIIDGRLIGARLAGDKKCIRMHTEALYDILNRMMSDATNLPMIASEVGKLIDNDSRFTPAAVVDALGAWRNGMPSKARDQLIGAGVSEDTLKHLAETLRYPLLAQRIAQGLTANLMKAAIALAAAAREIRLESKAIIAARK